VAQGVRRSFKWIGLIVLALAILAGAAAGRLAMGPVSAGALTPWLSDRADRALGDIQASFSELTLAWQVKTGKLRLGIEDARLTTPAGERLETGRLVVVCDLLALFSGELRAHAIRLDTLDLALTWNAEALADAAVRPLAPGAEAGPEPGEAGVARLPAPIMALLKAVAGDRGEAGVFSELERLRLAPVSARLTERASGTQWRLQEGAVTFRRAEGGLSLLARGALLGRGAVPAGRFVVTGRRAAGSAGWTTAVSLEKLDLPVLAAGIPALRRLAGVHLPLAAHVSARIGRNGRLTRADLTLEGGPGTLGWAPLYPVPVAVSELRGELGYDAATDRLAIRELAADFAGTTLSVEGRADLAAAQPELELKGGFGALTTPELVRYWPRGFADSGRAWIDENIPEGVVHKTDLALDIAAEDWRKQPLPAEAFRFNFGFDALTAHVMRPAPPVRAVSGTGRLTADRLTMELAQGRLQGLPVAGSRVAIRGLSGLEVPEAELDLRLSGELGRLLRLIDQPPMGYASAFGIAPGQVQGRTALAASLDFPLLADLPLERVRIDVEADIDPFAIPELVGGYGLHEGRLSLNLDNDSLSGRGSGRFAGLPLELEWDERFDAPASALPSRYAVTTRLDSEAFGRLLGDPGERFTGTAGLEVVVEGDGPKLRRGRLRADLAEAGLALPELAWRKPAGKAGRLAAVFDFPETGGDTERPVLNFSELSFVSGEDRLRASLRLNPRTGELHGLRIAELALGRNAFSGRVRFAEGGGLAGRLEGAALDLTGLLDRLAPPEPPSRAAPPGPPLDLDLAFDTVYGLSGVQFGDVSVTARRARGRWQRLALEGSINGDARLNLDLAERSESAGRRLTVDAGDTGRVLAGLGLLDLVEGGDLRFEADLAGHGAALEADGLARLEDFRLRQDPAIKAPLEADEQSKLEEYIGEDGIDFSRARLPFTLREGIVDIEGGRISGPELGITVEGQMDRALTRMNVNGVIVPAYFFNSLLGHIPLLGDLFTGGSGGGLFAFSYRVSGEAGDPNVEIDTLTALAPGILRKPFEGSKGRIEPQEATDGEEEEPVEDGGG